MGKRSDKFKRNPRGFYPTPESAVRPLLGHLPDAVQFDEPCAGDGALVRHLEAAGHSLAFASDIHPMAKGVANCDALNLDRCNGDIFITNPPWPEQRTYPPTQEADRPLAGARVMNTIFEGFSDHAAPSGHVTFTVLDQESSGHSVSVASKEYPSLVHATKCGLSNMPPGTVFKGAIEIIRRSAACIGGGCQCDDDGLLYAFISALLNHPNKRYRKLLMASVSTIMKKSGGARVILSMPPDGPSAWIIDDPSSRVQVH